MKRKAFIIILFTICTACLAQNVINSVEDLRFCHLYCEMSDGRYGTIGVMGTGENKEIGGHQYAEINIGPLMEDGSVRAYQRNGEDIVMYSMETLVKEGISLYYRQDKM